MKAGFGKLYESVDCVIGRNFITARGIPATGTSATIFYACNAVTGLKEKTRLTARLGVAT